ncbi:porphyromonas-type peptidyl-arginine deiminase [Streptomyces sulfonofaciens]|uniref:Porphyromonas-type peptidyl-arginine deiminase n=1 Tax=Streptomyces sulfonofaciens TaxID=68272 RepID=A0A919GJM6_9ACTN|nr:agmatine deiminase family protein [Streptomyces sulfonofaciens]GHH85230.1 porphyromonas-type peptidyl-arginine deiminase [Streptomyces sulfonofaciens]
MPSGAHEDGRRTSAEPAVRWHMPAEWQRHERTFMAWPSSDSGWREALPAVREDVAGIARAVAEHEPVTLLAAPSEAAEARRACGGAVEIASVPVDDLWMRDSGPTFVTGSGRVAGVDFHFNGWGGKQPHERDARVARRLLSQRGLRRIDAPVTTEGGALEVDGERTLIVAESSLVNINRNPGRSRDRIEGALKRCLGVSKVIWIAGLRGRDITDYHIDAVARFVEPGTVVISRPPSSARPDLWTRAYHQARQVLKAATDARGRELRVVELPEPDPTRIGRRGRYFIASYANYYVVNGAVLLPRFGDPAGDQRAAALIRDLHPGRAVVQLEINTLAEGGGGIHCATKQQPSPR